MSICGIEKETYEDLKKIFKMNSFTGTDEEKVGYEAFLEKTFIKDSKYYNLFMFHEKIILCGILHSPYLLIKLSMSGIEINDYSKMQEAIKSALQFNLNDMGFYNACCLFLQFNLCKYLYEDIDLTNLYFSQQNLIKEVNNINQRLEQNNQQIRSELTSKYETITNTINENESAYNVQFSCIFDKLDDIEKYIQDHTDSIQELLHNNEGFQPVYETDKKLLYRLKESLHYIDETDWEPYNKNTGLLQYDVNTELFKLTGGAFYTYKKQFTLDESKTYNLSCEYKKESEQCNKLLLFFQCFDRNKNVIKENHVKELTNPQKIKKIDLDRKTFYIETSEKWEIGTNKWIAFNTTEEIDTTSQILLKADITSICYNDSEQSYEIKLNKEISNAVNDSYFVALHESGVYFGFYVDSQPNNEFQSFSLIKKGFSKTTHNNGTFPICAKYFNIQFKLKPDLLPNIILLRNIKLEMIDDNGEIIRLI